MFAWDFFRLPMWLFFAVMAVVGAFGLEGAAVWSYQEQAFRLTMALGTFLVLGYLVPSSEPEGGMFGPVRRGVFLGFPMLPALLLAWFLALGDADRAWWWAPSAVWVAVSALFAGLAWSADRHGA